jgi:hypothetical protein
MKDRFNRFFIFRITNWRLLQTCLLYDGERDLTPGNSDGGCWLLGGRNVK